MSEKKFKEAKGNLAFSQSLIEKLRQPQQDPNMAQPQDQMATHGQQPQPESNPQAQPPQGQPDIAQVVKDTMEPYLKKIEELVASKTPQDVSLKIDGTMEPK